MVKLILLTYLLICIAHASVHYYDCEDRAYCNRYRQNLIWGKNKKDEVKLNSQYNVDNFTVNNETSSIAISLSHNLTLLNTTSNNYSDEPLIPTD